MVANEARTNFFMRCSSRNDWDSATFPELLRNFSGCMLETIIIAHLPLRLVSSYIGNLAPCPAVCQNRAGLDDRRRARRVNASALGRSEDAASGLPDRMMACGRG